MKDPKKVDSVITFQHFHDAGGFITQANEISFTH